MIDLCQRASVPESEWRDRDSEGAQRQVGECLMLLRAGCKFEVDPKVEYGSYSLEIWSKGFQYFEIHEMRSDFFYVPTAERLAGAAGKDWYR